MKIIFQQVGAPVKELTLTTGDTIAKLMELAGIQNHFIAKVNGVDATIDTVLQPFNVVTFSERIKGGVTA